MTRNRVNSIIQAVRSAALLHQGAGSTDGQLLECFISSRDATAIEGLVQRHAPMVWGVCRRILRNHQDAEDAFQATFLVLVRNAPTIKPREMVANWLYGVSRQTALKARATAAKRREREIQVTEMPEPEAVQRGEVCHDVQSLLDDELSRLPDIYRVAIVLCDLEGKTRKEAARQLGVPDGTLAARLARGRTMLAKRLGRHGLAISGPSLATVLAQNAQGCVPVLVMNSTLKAVTSVAAGQAAAKGLISARVAGLTEGVVKAMFLTKLQRGVIVLLGVFALPVVTGLLCASLGMSSQTDPKVKLYANPAEQNQPMAADMKSKGDDGRLVHTLLGHKERLTSVAFTPDGQWIATAAWDGTARLWEAQTGKQVRRLDVPPTKYSNPAHLSRIMFSPDNEFVVTAQQSMPNEPGVIVWKRRTGERVRDFPGLCAAFSPDGKHIAYGGHNAIAAPIRVYEFPTGKLVREMGGQEECIESLTFSLDGSTLFSTGRLPRPDRGDGIERDGLMPHVFRVWDVATGKKRPSALDGADADVLQRLALSPDGRTLAEAGTLVEIATGGGRGQLKDPIHEVAGLVFSPDGRTLATAGYDGTVRLWDLLSGKELGCFGKPVDSLKARWVIAVAFSPDGRTLVSGGLDKKAHIWDVSQITGRHREVTQRSPADLETDWKDLGGDAAKGYAALGRLVSSPGKAVAFLGKYLQSAKVPDSKRIEQLIGNLDDAQFQVREQAKQELAALGEDAAPLVRKALAGKPSLEARQRLEALLDQLDGVSPSAETVRQVRAVEALELIGNPEARRLLLTLAAGPLCRLTQEAKASAERLEQLRKTKGS
jgi:RNA polymerase sigma factor (sigma-70 family)